MKTDFFKKGIAVVGTIGVLALGATEVPLIPVQMEWMESYETLEFDTPSGDMEEGYYALSVDGKQYYYRTKSKDEFQFEATTTDKLDISRLQAVSIVGKSYYNVYKNRDGKEVRIKSNELEYKALALPDAGQPEKTELVPLISPNEAEAAIAFDFTNDVVCVVCASNSFPHTISGANTLLTVGFGGSGAINTATFNGDSLTFIRSDTDPSTSKNSEIWYMIAPDDGEHNVVVDYGGTAIGAVGTISLTGARQTSQPDAHGGGNGESDPASADVVTVADNSWVIDIGYAEGGFDTPDASQTQRWEAGETDAGGSTYGPKTPAGTVTMFWSGTGGGGWALSAASFAPAGAPATTPANLKIEGGNINIDGGSLIIQ